MTIFLIAFVKESYVLTLSQLELLEVIMYISAKYAAELCMKEKYKHELCDVEANIRNAAINGEREITYSLLNENNHFSQYLAKTLTNTSMHKYTLKSTGMYPEFLSYIESYGYRIKLNMVEDIVTTCTISW